MIKTSYHIGRHAIEAEASENGDRLSIYVDGEEVVTETGLPGACMTWDLDPLLSGAAARSQEEKTLREHSTNSLLACLLADHSDLLEMEA